MVVAVYIMFVVCTYYIRRTILTKTTKRFDKNEHAVGGNVETIQEATELTTVLIFVHALFCFLWFKSQYYFLSDFLRVW